MPFNTSLFFSFFYSSSHQSWESFVLFWYLLSWKSLKEAMQRGEVIYVIHHICKISKNWLRRKLFTRFSILLWHKNLYYCHKRCKFFSLKYIHDNSWMTFYVLQKEFCFINSWFHMCCLCDRSPSPLGSLLYVQCHQSPGAGCRRGKVSCCLMNHD